MKKKAVCTILMLVLAVFAGCGREEAENGDKQAEDTAVSADAEQEDGDGMGRQESENIEEKAETEETENTEDNTMKITAGDAVFTASFADNSSAEALKELLAEGPLTVSMSDYAGMEKVGPLGTDLPRNDEQITTEAGDIILYQGNSITIYYDTNAWSLTRIGRIHDVTKEDLLEAFGDGDVTVTFSLE